MAETSARAYSYLRFSTPEQMKGDSYRRQTELAERYAVKNDLTLDKDLRMEDQGVSAFRANNVRSGALGRFLRAIDDGFVTEGSYLLVENLDRVSRANPWDAMPIFQQIINAGVTIVTLQDEKTWSREQMRENPFRIFESLMVMIRANEESEVKARRNKAAWEGKRSLAKEKKLTARCPSWLKLQGGCFVVIEDRAAIVRRIFDLATKGFGHERIAETLNRDGVPCFGSGRHWHKSYISKLIASDAPIGTYIPHQMVHAPDGRKTRKPLTPVEGYFPAIVDETVFQTVRTLRTGVRLPTVRGGSTLANIFASLAKCPDCGGSMTRVSKGRRGGKAYLVCQAAKMGAGCTYRAVVYDSLEAVVVSSPEDLLKDSPSGNSELDEALDSVWSEIEELDLEIDNLVDSIAEQPSPALSARLRRLEDAREGLHSKLNKLRDQLSATSAGAVASAKKALIDALQRPEVNRAEVNRCLRLLLSSITLNYQRGSLGLTWKDGTQTSFVYDAVQYWAQ